MPFGIKSAQEVFHKRIRQQFEDIDNVETNIDDIHVCGQIVEEYDDRLNNAIDIVKRQGSLGIKNNVRFEQQK